MTNFIFALMWVSLIVMFFIGIDKSIEMDEKNSETNIQNIKERGTK